MTSQTSSVALYLLSVKQKVGASDSLDSELLKALENSVQEEMDEQLRILNEREIMDRQIRNLIIKVRDESYDAMAASTRDDSATRLETEGDEYSAGVKNMKMGKKENIKEKMSQGVTYATMAITRFSRQV